MWRALLFVLLTPCILFGQSLDQTHINWHNPLLNGIECNSGTLQAAVSAIGTEEKTLFLTATNRNKVDCTWSITNNVTIPNNIRLRIPLGVKATLAAGVTLTVDGCIDADSTAWFSGSGSFVATQTCEKDPAVWMGAFQSYVQAGCLHQNVGATTISVPPCIVWIKSTSAGRPTLERSEELTAQNVLLNAGDGLYWHIYRLNTAETPAGWTCMGTTHYCWSVSTSRPRVPSRTILLSSSKVVSSQVTAVGDYRHDSPIPGAPTALTSSLFGAIPDCVTDNTVAIQAFINNLGWRQVPGTAPAGCYKFSRIWLNYDPVNNPQYPSDDLKQGNYTLTGEGSMQVNHTIIPQQEVPGTLFVSTHTTAPAINAFSATGTGAANALRGLRLRQFSVQQATSSFVMTVDGANSRSAIESVFIHQAGTGGGLEWKNTFLVGLRDLFMYADNPANTGLGMHLTNTTSQGGVIDLVNVTGRGFGSVCIRIGSENVTGKRMQGIDMRGVQGRTCPIGIQIWSAVSGGTCTGCYTEDTTTYGMEIREGVYGFNVIGGFFSGFTHSDPTDAVIKIGGDGTSSAANRAWGINIQGARIIEGQTGYGIWRNLDNEIDGAVLLGNSFDAPVPYNGRAIYCGTGGTTTQNSLIVAGNQFDTEHLLTEAISGGCRVGEIIQDNIAQYQGRRLNLGQGLGVLAAATVALPANGNIFNLTGKTGVGGVVAISNIQCGPCMPGAMVWFFVQQGNQPSMVEGGNIKLSDTASPPNTWTLPNDTGGHVIGLMWQGTSWIEMHRSSN